MYRQEKPFGYAFLLRRAMSNLAITMKGEKRSAGRSEHSGKPAMKNHRWEEISRPIRCYLVMLIISVFQTLLAILLLPYNLLNRQDVK